MIVVEFLGPKPVSDTIKELGPEHTEPAIWLPGTANVAVVYVGSEGSDHDWVIVTNRRTGERVKVTLA